MSVLKSRLDARNYDALMAIGNERVVEFVTRAVELCNPAKVWVSTDSAEDYAYNRKMALETGEEKKLDIEGHTIHFDGYNDQGRDREATKYLVPSSETLSKALNQIEREQGLTEVFDLLKDSMSDRTMIIRFMTLGPVNSEFSIPCLECTDSFYVSHSLNLLYRPGYAEFKRLGAEADFFSILHSSGKLDGRMVSAEPENRKIYIDYTTDSVYTVNTQYAGNTVGLKKLALRLSIRKADREGWLA
jgi:phosphoenolpyruvate carboxykinase (GTP)